MSIDTIRTNIDKANHGLSEIRAQLLAVRKEHEAAIKEVDALLAALPVPKAVKAPPVPSKPAPAEKAPSIGDQLLSFVRGQPGATLAAIVDAHPQLKRKSVENTVSRLTTAGTLVREGKGYAAA